VEEPSLRQYLPFKPPNTG